MVTENVYWQVHGDFITNLAREKVLESYRNGCQFLQASFPTMTLEQINDILNGKKRLTGINDLGYEDELPEIREEHEAELKYAYRNIFFQNGDYYKPIRKVVSYGYNDAEDGSCGSPLNPSQVAGRASHYKQSFSDIVYYNKEDRHNYICEKVIRNLPFWVNDKDLTFELCIDNCRIDDVGHDEMYGEEDEEEIPSAFEPTNDQILTDYIASELQITNNIKKFAELEKYNIIKIKKQAEIHGYIDLKTLEGEVVATVPKAPFYHWAFARVRMNKEVIQLPEWDVVSKSGVKMYGDNPYHTDWMLGGGVDSNEYYGNDSVINRASYHMQNELQSDLLKYECTVLSSSEQGWVIGDVVLVNGEEDFDKVEDDSIIVIPNAGINFTEAFLKATKSGNGGVICQYGSRVAHLCKISREKDVIILQEDGCMEKYYNGCGLSLSSEDGTIRVID